MLSFPCLVRNSKDSTDALFCAMKQAVEGIYEYWQIQREGKTTLMVRDMLRLNEFYGMEWDRFHTNFKTFIPAVHNHSSESLLQYLGSKDPGMSNIFRCASEISNHHLVYR